MSHTFISVDDWKQIRRHAEALGENDLRWWLDALLGSPWCPSSGGCQGGLCRMLFLAGFFGVHQGEATLTLRPSIGWGVCDDRR